MPLLLLLALLALLAHRGARAAPFSATRAREFRGHGRPAFDVFEAAARPEGAAESLISPCPAAPPRPVPLPFSPAWAAFRHRSHGSQNQWPSGTDFEKKCPVCVVTVNYDVLLRCVTVSGLRSR